ncbi:MAG TPA: hypothetical protein VGP05_01880, partial [Pseudonocardia sp.]|nr:hypothetical protein [Pseudonocardia sp.]
SVIYGAKTVRGFWLYHSFASTPPARIRATVADVISLVDKGAVTVPRAGRSPSTSRHPPPRPPRPPPTAANPS